MAGATVLVVDDDQRLLSSVQRSFSTRMRVLTCSSCSEARSLAQSESVDLAIIDLRLDRESGIALARELRRDHPQLRIAIVSAYLSVALATASLRAGADVALFKPYTCADILRALDPSSPVPESGDDQTPTLARAEWEHITRVLCDCDGNISRAARRLGILRQALQRRLRKYPPRA